jgi:metallophosphoesterase (TIGR00282 family)
LSTLRVLFIGDVFGRPGRKAVSLLIPQLQRQHGFELIIANGENIAGGVGLTPKTANELFRYGVDILTTGNHVWDKKEGISYIETEERVIRPANYPEGVPGRGFIIVKGASGFQIGVMNVAGRVYLSQFNDPFAAVNSILETLRPQTNIIILDFHAEATAEKMAMGHYLDGKVTAVIGTHTHVQTADEQILPLGTAYITDVGMTGPHDSVIGVVKGQAIKKFLTQMPHRFEAATKNVIFCAVIIEVDPQTGKSVSIQRLRIPIDDLAISDQQSAISVNL